MHTSRSPALALTITASLLLLGTGLLSAQGPTPLGLSERAVHSISTPHRAYRDSIPQTEWKTGMLVGGGIGAALGLLVASAAESLCEDRDGCGSKVPFILGSTALFAVIGSLIGSGFHKNE